MGIGLTREEYEEECQEWQEQIDELIELVGLMLAELETVEYDSDPPDRVLKMLERARATVQLLDVHVT